MIAALADIIFWPESTDTAPAPRPKPRAGPLLMGDILTMRQGEPEILIRWREDRARLDDASEDRP